jgi:hypothetical protein
MFFIASGTFPGNTRMMFANRTLPHYESASPVRPSDCLTADRMIDFRQSCG